MQPLRGLRRFAIRGLRRAGARRLSSSGSDGGAAASATTWRREVIGVGSGAVFWACAIQGRPEPPAQAEQLFGRAGDGQRVFIWGQRAAFPVSDGASGAPPAIDLRSPTEVSWFRRYAETHRCTWCQVAFGPSFGVARTDGGELFVWGSMKLAEGKKEVFLEPHRVAWEDMGPGGRFVDAQCSESALWALTDSGDVIVWERVSRMLAEKNPASDSALVGGKRVAGLDRPVRRMAVGPSHAAFITDNGDVYCLGSNRCGECGADPAKQGFASACRLVRFSRHVNPVLHVACGRSHTVVVGAEGQALSWGDDSKIQLGLGDTRSNIGDERPWEGSRGYLNFIATGESMAPAAATRGGPNSPSFSKARQTSGVRYGEFDAHMQWRPSMMMDIPLEFERQVHGTPYPPPDSVVCGDDFTILVVRDSPDWFAPEEESNRIFCCGENGRGQCGRSLQASQQIFSATKLPRNSATDSLSCGSDHCLAVLQRVGHRKREVWAWGSNSHGQAGGSSTATACPAVRVRFPRGVRVQSVWCGFASSAAICVGKVATETSAVEPEPGEGDD